jgi:HlyD family secretion protein
LSERVLGSSFSQGTHLMTVADLSKMEARVDVDENDVVRISVDDTAKVEIDAYGDQQFIGIVYQIGNSAQTTGLGSQDEVVNFEVRISLIDSEKSIRPGMSCDADIQTETKLNVVSVPIQSVTARMPSEEPSESKNETNDSEGSGSNGENEEENKDQSAKRNKPEEVVFLVDNGVAKKVKVETGISNDNFIEIIEGLEGGEEVINGPYRAISKDLNDNTKIMVRKDRKGNQN